MIYKVYNIIRIVVACLGALMTLYSLHDMAMNTELYRMVYMGPFGYKSLGVLAWRWGVSVALFILYIYIVSLHMKRYSRNIWFIVLLAMTDICFVAWTMYKICNPPNI